MGGFGGQLAVHGERTEQDVLSAQASRRECSRSLTRFLRLASDVLGESAMHGALAAASCALMPADTSPRPCGGPG